MNMVKPLRTGNCVAPEFKSGHCTQAGAPNNLNGSTKDLNRLVNVLTFRFKNGF
jgi:hypothetical protein